MIKEALKIPYHRIKLTCFKISFAYLYLQVEYYEK